MSSGQAIDPVSILARLAERPYAVSFRVALRRLECQFRRFPRLGAAAHPREEPIRVGQMPSVAFAPSEIDAFEPATESLPARLYVTFFGMFGPNGALPLHLTEYARDRLRNAGDATFARFIDLFHHRTYLLLYRAWARTQPTVAEDRPEDSAFRTYLGSLTGYGLPSLRQRDSLGDEFKWYYAGLLAGTNRSADGLRALVADYFDLPARIEEFVGEWVALPEDARFRLGGSAATSSLGRTSVLGRRVWMCQHRFRVVLGPMGREHHRDFLPGARGLTRLVALVRAYAGDEYSWDVRLVLAPRAVEPLRLGGGGRLGWDTRLGGAAGEALRTEDLIVDPTLGQTRRATSFARHPGPGEKPERQSTPMY